MTSLLDLAKNLEKLAKSVDERASAVAIKTAEVILKELVFVTPVDTSKALSNWQITLGAPAEMLRPPYYPGRLGSTQEQSANAAIKAGLDVLKAKRAGVSIFISNNAPYIRRLNEGWSSQAPAGFVERAEMLGRKFAENYKGK